MAAQVDDLTPATEFLHGSESVVYPDAGYRGIEQRIEMKGRVTSSGSLCTRQAASAARHARGSNG